MARTHFEPDNWKQNELFERGRDVPNPCRNCSLPWMDHVNGLCPAQDPAGARDEFAAEYDDKPAGPRERLRRQTRER